MEQSDLLHQLRIDRSEPEARSPALVAWIVGALVLLAAIGGGAWWWFSHAGKTFDVDVATAAAPAGATLGPGAVLQATGYVTARREATVSAQITGTLTQVLIEEGDRVEKGQVLGTLEDTAQRASLAQAQAGLRAAQAQLAQFQSQLGQSRRDLARAEDLVTRKLVSAQSVEVARTQVETQLSQLETQRKQVELGQAGVQAAQVQLDYCTVRAPFAGMIIAKAAQVGEIISPLSAGGGFTRTGIGTIVDMESLEVEVDVTESYINRVVPGQPTEAVLDAYPDWKIPGHVIAIIPTADRGKATIKVRVALDHKDTRVVPDMGARVSFLEDTNKPVSAAPVAPPKGALVPAASVVQRDGKAVVFEIAGDTVRQRGVSVVREAGDQRLVEGVPVGARVVREPPAELGDGARVAVKAPQK